MPATEKKATGWLLLADISGYTALMSGSELEHAHDIVRDLMRGLVRRMAAPLRVVKSEGDALLTYALDPQVTDGRVLLDRIEDAYHGFRMQIFNIERSSTCTCAACKNARGLDLKFMVHHGEFIIDNLAGHDDLDGSDVILVHRLLKNEVREKLNLPAYLLVTDAARARMPGLEWTDHVESYEHLGEVRCGVRCLRTAFEEMRAAGAADVKPEQADFEVVFEAPAPPDVVWRWHVEEGRAERWQKGLDGWRVSPNAGGRLRAGATVHCQHGSETKSMQVLAWCPPSSITVDSPSFGGSPRFVMSMVFEPLDGGARTRVRWRGRVVERTLVNRLKGRMIGWMFPRMVRENAQRLAKLLADEKSAAA